MNVITSRGHPPQALAFVNKVGEIAERQVHHPDILLSSSLIAQQKETAVQLVTGPMSDDAIR